MSNYSEINATIYMCYDISYIATQWYGKEQYNGEVFCSNVSAMNDSDIFYLSTQPLHLPNDIDTYAACGYITYTNLRTYNNFNYLYLSIYQIGPINYYKTRSNISHVSLETYMYTKNLQSFIKIELN